MRVCTVLTAIDFPVPEKSNFHALFCVCIWVTFECSDSNCLNLQITQAKPNEYNIPRTNSNWKNYDFTNFEDDWREIWI